MLFYEEYHRICNYDMKLKDMAHHKDSTDKHKSES